jgi:hypothetical protein
MINQFLTVGDAENFLSTRLEEIFQQSGALPRGVHPVVTFRHDNAQQRKLRDDASFEKHFTEKWDERVILISFAFDESGGERPHRVTVPPTIPPQRAVSAGKTDDVGKPEEIEALIRALSRAQSRPTGFVGLKWFRDSGMSAEPALSNVDRGQLLRVAIERGIVRTGKVNNPKNPEFPVTSIWLENSAPEVRRVLAARQTGVSFAPVSLRGEPLSRTVARERR